MLPTQNCTGGRAPIYRAAIENEPLKSMTALLVRGEALEAAGYHQQVKVTASIGAAIHHAKMTCARRSNDATNGETEFVIASETAPRKLSAESLSIASRPLPRNSVPTFYCVPWCRIIFCPRWLMQAGPRKRLISPRPVPSTKNLLGRVTPNHAAFFRHSSRTQSAEMTGATRDHRVR